MTQAFNGGDSSRFSLGEILAQRWQQLAIGSLGFWLSGSLILDLVIMPTLWVTGMMESSGFASASYSIFWIFNRLELVCAAAIVSSMWASIECARSANLDRRQMLAGAVMLVAIALSYTFVLTPYMSGLGINLDVLEVAKSLPTEMSQMHAIYWVLEVSKLGIIGLLLSLSDRAIAR
jgi:type II secretory pathway component PulM